ncbi:unnamed protein product, partial [Adineta steineri]
QIDRNRPTGASVMNTKDSMGKQKIPNIVEPGPLKRAQGIADLGQSPIDDPSGANSNYIDAAA